MPTKTSSSAAFSLIEVLLSVALFSLILVGLGGVYLYGLESSVLSGNRNRAILLAEEGLEAVRNIRDDDYSSLSAGTYGLGTSSGAWELTPSADTVGPYSREIVLTTNGTDRFDVSSQVSWTQNTRRQGLVALTSRLTHWMEIVAPQVDWSTPFESTILNLSGNTNATEVETQGDYAYVIRTGSSSNFVVLGLTGLPSLSQEATLSISGNVDDIFISGDYAYLASRNNSRELSIVDISNPASPSLEGTYNNSGNQNATSVYVTGGFAYMGFNRNNSRNFSIVNVSNPASPLFVNRLDLNGRIYSVYVSGGYAYLVGNNNGQELQVVNVLTPATALEVSNLNLPGNDDANVVVGYGNTLYIGQGDTLHIVDISNPLSPSLLGSLDLNDGITDLARSLGDNGALLYASTDDGTSAFQVIDVSNPNSPSLEGFVDIADNSGYEGLAYSSTYDEVLAVGTDNSNEVTLISP